MIALEYQGEQHYGHTGFEREDAQRIQQRDQVKMKQCQDLGITLIQIPYWWNGTRSQLELAIHKHRPDLVPSSPNANDISSTPYVGSGTAPSGIQTCNNRTNYAVPEQDYTLDKSPSSPSCRGCQRKIAPYELRVIARATNPLLSRPYKVQVQHDY
jgi:hypothetical protein